MGGVEVFKPLETWAYLAHGDCCFPARWAVIPTMGRKALTSGLSKTPQALLQRGQGIENHKALQDPRQLSVLIQT